MYKRQICGSAFKNKGVQFLLDAVCRYLPSPVDKEAIVGTNPDNDEEISRKPSVDEPFAALAFKIATDPFVGRLAFFRVYSGKLDAGSYVLNNRSGKKERPITSNTPTSIDATTAPRIDPMPPITMTTNARISISSPIPDSTERIGPAIRPARPARKEPIPKIIV